MVNQNRNSLDKRCSIAKLSKSDAQLLSDEVVARKKRCNKIRSNINPLTQELYHILVLGEVAE